MAAIPDSGRRPLNCHGFHAISRAHSGKYMRVGTFTSLRDRHDLFYILRDVTGGNGHLRKGGHLVYLHTQDAAGESVQPSVVAVVLEADPLAEPYLAQAGSIDLVDRYEIAKVFESAGGADAIWDQLRMDWIAMFNGVGINKVADARYTLVQDKVPDGGDPTLATAWVWREIYSSIVGQ